MDTSKSFRLQNVPALQIEQPHILCRDAEVQLAQRPLASIFECMNVVALQID